MELTERKRKILKALIAEYEQAIETGRNVDMLAVAEDYLSSGKSMEIPPEGYNDYI